MLWAWTRTLKRAVSLLTSTDTFTILRLIALSFLCGGPVPRLTFLMNTLEGAAWGVIRQMTHSTATGTNESNDVVQND